MNKDKIDVPKAQALFETAAEMLTDLRQALENYEQKNEEAWKKKNQKASYETCAAIL